MIREYEKNRAFEECELTEQGSNELKVQGNVVSKKQVFTTCSSSPSRQIFHVINQRCILRLRPIIPTHALSAFTGSQELASSRSDASS
jgi:hypothetical protein